MNNLKNRLMESLMDNGFKCVEKNNVVTFKVDNGRFKVFFHEDSIDLVLTYMSKVTESGTRNLVTKDIKNATELYNTIEEMVTGVELSNSVINSDKNIKDTLSFDTYNRYQAMKSILGIANELSFIA